MTAEIAILNRSAVAMAADSAATVSTFQEVNGKIQKVEKVFPSANKIFALSYLQPVGIMVFGNSAHMGVPWETIIKVLRPKLPPEGFPTLAEYAKWLRESLLNTPGLIPPAFEEQHIEAAFNSLLSQIFELLMQRLMALSAPATPADTTAAAAKIIGELHQGTSGARAMSDVNPAKRTEIEARIAPTVDRMIAEWFPNLGATADAQTILSLKAIALNCFCRDLGTAVPFAGVVIAGFGSSEVVPQLVWMRISGQLCGTLNWAEGATVSMDKEPPTIVPFAQREEVDTFFQGVHPSYAVEMDAVGATLSDGLEGAVKSVLGDGHASVSGVVSAATGAVRKSWVDGISRIHSFQRKRFVEPIAEVVGHLSKDELAQMAESLVNLTSFRRKMSWQTETVGGPIDVAVITKGDGLIWVKRKHYFSPDLNAHFFRNRQT